MLKGKKRTNHFTHLLHIKRKQICPQRLGQCLSCSQLSLHVLLYWLFYLYVLLMLINYITIINRAMFSVYIILFQQEIKKQNNRLIRILEIDCMVTADAYPSQSFFLSCAIQGLLGNTALYTRFIHSKVLLKAFYEPGINGRMNRRNHPSEDQREESISGLNQSGSRNRKKASSYCTVVSKMQAGMR